MSAKTVEAPSSKISAKTINSDKIIDIRVSPNGYLAALFLASFASGLLVYLEKDLTGMLIFGAGWIIIPLFAWSDRITFDGRRLVRTGFLPQIWTKLGGSKYRLKISDIEQVETQALRALKRGGNVFYRYRTVLSGKGLRFVLASGGEDYRRMIHKIFPLLPENALDNRSVELRDFLSEPKETLMKAEFAKIPSAEVLENSFGKLNGNDKKLRKAQWDNKEISGEAIEKADYLHHLANELRLSGYLLQALEAFRRALFLNPKDARLIFDFARCLHSFAGAEGDENLTRKAFAALRLAEKRAENNPEMLSRLGESYFQYGKWRRAQAVFQKATGAAEEDFRSRRGLAEIALREGKIAYVIHHFSTANRIADTSALKRWTQNESDYFARLNQDGDYMELEVSRVNMLEGLERSKKTCLQIALLSFPAIIIGITLEENTMAEIGWAISSVALLVWVGVIVSLSIFSARIPLDFENEE